MTQDLKGDEAERDQLHCKNNHYFNSTKYSDLTKNCMIHRKVKQEYILLYNWCNKSPITELSLADA